MNNKILLVLAGVIILIVAIVGIYLWYVPNSSENNQADDETAVRNTVEDFGKTLQNVSLLSPTVGDDIRDSYKEYLTPELLEEWANNPTEALGRLTSSPWPDRIEIMDMQRVSTDSYFVASKIIEVTDEGVVASRNVDLAINKTGDKWLISDVILYPYEEEETRQVRLYYYNPELDKDESENIKCSPDGLVAVEREIPLTITPIQDTIKLLLEGDLTDAEKEEGITTEYPLEGFSLQAASLEGGELILTFDDPNNETIGGSCRTGILWFQISTTAKQFAEVEEVKFAPEDLFQP